MVVCVLSYKTHKGYIVSIEMLKNDQFTVYELFMMLHTYNVMGTSL